MATEIIRWCDAHLFTDERVPGGPHTVQVDGKTGTVDLCDDHAKMLLGPVVDLMAPDPKRTSTGAGRTPEPGPARCFICDRGLRPERMSAHLTNAHGLTVRDVYGTRCPVCGDTFGTANAVGTHGARKHGVGTTVGLWVQVEEAGDPDGVVAARRAGAIRGDRP